MVVDGEAGAFTRMSQGRRSAASRGPLAGTQYVLLSRLGAGGAGEVYLARHRELNKKVVVKLLQRRLAARADIAERMRREARVLARVRHPSLVDVYDMGVSADGRPYFVMEWVDGDTLREHLEKHGGGLDPVEACTLVAQVLDGLAAAHEAGVVHRDVKPLNVIVTRDGRAKLLDFGVARVLDEAEPREGATAQGIAVGTPKYMAPEQACGERPTPAVDVYAAACVLFETLTGAPPFDDDVTSEVVRAHVTKAAPRLADRAGAPFDPDLERVVALALSKGPADRPESAAAFADALRRIARRLSGEADSGGARTTTGGITANLRTPSKSRTARRGNVKPPQTAFLGRERELAALQAMISAGDRVVTVLGSGGIGKSRLALRYAELHEDELSREGGAWFCDMSDARDLEGVCAAVARALDVPLRSRGGGEAMLAQIGQVLAGTSGRTFVVLDNGEQVVGDVAHAVEAWREAAPSVSFVVTSREVLHVTGERVFELPPLSVPEDDAEAGSSEAVQLFVDRAQRVRPDYALTPAEAPHVAAIVRQLDGLPLAIELAAARVNVMSAQSIVQRLPRRFDLLASGTRGVAERQRTLRGAIDWSWALLGPWEKSALAQCAVFRGGFTLEAAEKVIDLSAFPGAPQPLDALQALRDKSLVRTFESRELAGELCFGLYESIREFAWEKLEASGDRDATLARHIRCFARLGTDLAQAMSRPGGAQALRRLAALRDNLVAAHERALAQGDVESAARIAISMERVALDQGPHEAFCALYDATVGAAQRASLDASLLGPLMVARGLLRFVRMDQEGARADAQAVTAIAARTGDVLLEMRALQILGQLGFLSQNADEMHAAYDRLASLVRGVTAPHLRGFGRMTMGVLLVCEGRRLDEARENLEIALADLREVGDTHRLATALHLASVLALDTGRVPDARTYLLQAIEASRETHDRFREATCLMYLALCFVLDDDLAKGLAACDRAVRNLERIGERWQHALALGLRGAIDALLGDVDRARAAVDRAETELLSAGDRVFVVAVRVHAGQVDLALARACEAAGDVAAAARHREDAEKRLVGVDEHTSDDVRFAVRLLRRSLSRAPRVEADAATSPDALVVASDGGWFKAPRGKRVDLARRRALVRLLRALVEHRVASPGTALSPEILLEKGWPGERVLHDAGLNRVRVALATLRRLGLRDVLRSEGDGYALDPAVPLATARKPERSKQGRSRS